MKTINKIKNWLNNHTEYYKRLVQPLRVKLSLGNYQGSSADVLMRLFSNNVPYGIEPFILTNDIFQGAFPPYKLSINYKCYYTIKRQNAVRL